MPVRFGEPRVFVPDGLLHCADGFAQPVGIKNRHPGKGAVVDALLGKSCAPDAQRFLRQHERLFRSIHQASELPTGNPY
ncbi:MAG TPA: hypothetical protein VNN17_02150 [Terriglobia bacterium]|nr:hypothetical protein [Terriglobia bacterium]